MDLLGSDAVGDRVLSVVNEIRAGAECPGLLNAFSEASNDHVSRTVLTIALGDDFGDDTGTAAVETMKELLSSDSPRRPQALSQRETLLSKFATHMDCVLNNKTEEGGETTLRLDVFFKYLELAGVGPVIDGDLVVQGSCLSPSFSPAICKVEFAADHEETMVDAATIAPWMMMYTPSPNPNESNSEFAVPITLGVEHREGHVRVRIYVDKTEDVPYGEENASYLDAFAADVKGERFVCALDFTTRATSAEGGPAADGLASGSVVLGDDADGFAAAATGEESLGSPTSFASPGKKVRRVKRTTLPTSSDAASAENAPVVIDVKIAIGYDDAEALRSEGYQLSCSHLHADGVKEEDEEGKWGYFVMAKFGELPQASAPAQAAAAEAPLVVAEAVDGEQKLESDGMEAAAADEETKSGVDASVASPSIDVVVDIIYVEVPKDAAASVEEGSTLEATLVSQGLLPEGYTLLPQDLLAIEPAPSSAPEDGAEDARSPPTSSVFIAFKRSPSSLALVSKIVSLGMFSFAKEVESTLLPDFLSHPGKSLKAAPGALNSVLGADLVSGILVGTSAAAAGAAAVSEDEWIDVEEDDDEVEGEVAEKRAIEAFVHHGASSEDKEVAEDDNKLSRAQSRSSYKDDDDAMQAADEEDPDESTAAYDPEEDEAVLLERLLAKVEELSSEKETLATANADLQRKAAVLIAREKAQLQGQTRAGAAPEEVTGKEDEPQKEEHLQEKEKQFSEILVHIVEARKKASQQQLEYDQLALDLQTRLDDRNFKAGEIYDSFKTFKKEILNKAENSRTSKPMSKRLIKQFEAAELQREEDLERVRLRNISMRTQLKKMEKTLRAREQLAEGLYMIDFEQLKVENQTLYEKIEERSEELVKLKRKKTITVQMLTHVREKLRFIENVSRVSAPHSALHCPIVPVRPPTPLPYVLLSDHSSRPANTPPPP